MIALLPRLRRFAIALTGSRQNADDLVQGACERALAARASWTPGTRFDAWMFRILRNLWIDMLRKQRTEGVRESIEERYDLVGAQGEKEAEDRLMLAALREAVKRLPEEQREVLLLVCVEDMSYRDAADALDVPVGTVMSRLSRARARLSEMTGFETASRRAAAS
jgi:RNA polymerase sigma-70 factor (ECF subfamily)